MGQFYTPRNTCGGKENGDSGKFSKKSIKANMLLYFS
jgi:hypothetical protein